MACNNTKNKLVTTIQTLFFTYDTAKENFFQFCQRCGLVVHYITRENKNSELFFILFPRSEIVFFAKKIPMIAEDFTYLSQENEISMEFLIRSKDYTIWREIFIHKTLNQLVVENLSPHFPLLYHYCFSFDDDHKGGNERPHGILILEKMQEDVKSWANGYNSLFNCFLPP